MVNTALGTATAHNQSEMNKSSITDVSVINSRNRAELSVEDSTCFYFTFMCKKMLLNRGILRIKSPYGREGGIPLNYLF